MWGEYVRIHPDDFRRVAGSSRRYGEGVSVSWPNPEAVATGSLEER